MSSNGAASLVPILDRSNYGAWSTAMKAYLMLIGLWPVIAGDVAKPTSPKTPPMGASQEEKENYKTALLLYATEHKAWCCAAYCAASTGFSNSPERWFGSTHKCG